MTLFNMAGSDWDIILSGLTESLKDRLNCFKREDLVGFCLDNKEIRNVAENFLQGCTIHKKLNSKNSDVAVKKKEEGNQKYKEKNYKESLSLYTESIFNANSNDECLSLAYSNRSLVLQHMGHFLESLQDINMALSSGYPKNKSEKLIIRKSKCLVELGDLNKATEILTKAMKELSSEESLPSIKQQLRIIKNIKKKKISNLEYELPELIGGKNENFVSASKYLNVFYSQSKGRHVIAKQDIEIGDILFVEKPFAFVYFKEVCHNCGKNTVAPIPCSNCLEVSYCSLTCRDDFWKLAHSFECGYSRIFKSIGIAHLSLRIILAASNSLKELKMILNQLKEPIYKDGIIFFKSNKYDSVYNLVTNIEKYETSDLFQYIMTAVLLGLFMKNHTNYFSKTSDDEDLKLFVSVVYRHIMQLICNGHAIVETFLHKSEKKEVMSETEERIGTAIYPSVSMMNHSCEPSIINSFYKNYLIVRASKKIKKGEEVFNCYGPHARRMKRAERQEILSKQYFFKCECQACVQKFDIQDMFTALKCKICKGPLIPKEENSDFMMCLNCGQICIVSAEITEKQVLIYSLSKQGEVLLEENISLALKKFLESWFLGREIFFTFHKDLSQMADKIAKCLVLLRDYERCIMFLKCCVLSVEKRFGSFSIELANEMKKLGDAITNYSAACEQNKRREIARQGFNYYQKAQKIINLLFGSHHPDLELMEENKKILESFLST